ncbi:MAG TPA: hypothetical protein VG759_04625, partial [Candidatus Angelobacter sp.]|nr:hypothetical protein [Candidatus Angelobacter sp.]
GAWRAAVDSIESFIFCMLRLPLVKVAADAGVNREAKAEPKSVSGIQLRVDATVSQHGLGFK